MSEENNYRCPVCGMELRGGLVVIVIETDEARNETIYESPWRNWMKCQFCKLILCKECGTSADDSYCHPCSEREGIKPLPQDFTHRVKLTIRKEEIISSELAREDSKVF
jgi:hypothetical protein